MAVPIYAPPAMICAYGGGGPGGMCELTSYNRFLSYTFIDHSGEHVCELSFDDRHLSLFCIVFVVVFIDLSKFFLCSGHSSFVRHVLCKHLPANRL